MCILCSLVLSVPLSFANTSTYEEAIEGEDVVLPCQPQGSPVPTVTWQHDNKILPLRVPQGGSAPGTDLNIKSVAPQHSGVYTCSASNGIGDPVSRDVMLKVFGELV